MRIAELGSFTHAAEVMRTMQSAVSLKLKRLEKRFPQALHRLPSFNCRPASEAEE